MEAQVPPEVLARAQALVAAHPLMGKSDSRVLTREERELMRKYHYLEASDHKHDARTLEAIENYASFLHYDFNNALWGGDQTALEEASSWSDLTGWESVDALTEAIGDFERADRVLWRGMEDPHPESAAAMRQAWDGGFKPGTRLCSPSFTSTSLDPNNMLSFSSREKRSVYLEILTGRGLAIGASSPETEVLLPRHMGLVVAGQKEILIGPDRLLTVVQVVDESILT